MRAIISVIGHDKVGILARVTAECAARGVNVMDVTQSVLQDMFAMIMLVDLSAATVPVDELADAMEAVGNEMGMAIRVMHEDLFNAMHTV